MSALNAKKLLKRLSIPICVVAAVLLVVITYWITKLGMEAQVAAVEQRMDAEKAVYEQRIAALLERLETGTMTQEGIAKTYDELSDVNDLLVRVRGVDSALDRLNGIIYNKLLKRNPEIAAKALIDELKGEHSDWAYRFLTEYVVDDHIRNRCILSLRVMARTETNRELRQKAQQVLAHFEGKTK